VNLHALVDPPVDPATNVEPDVDGPACPDCGGRSFRQYYWGNMNNTRYIDFRENGVVDVYEDTEETEERDSDRWECEHGHALGFELHEEIREEWMQQ
jgi:hypothetical protein